MSEELFKDDKLAVAVKAAAADSSYFNSSAKFNGSGSVVAQPAAKKRENPTRSLKVRYFFMLLTR